MNINFFSWNVGKNKDPKLYSDLTAELKQRKIDVLILQESAIDAVKALPDYDEVPEFAQERGVRTVRIFLQKMSRISVSNAKSYVGNKLRCIVITTKKGFRFNCCGVHLYSMAGGKSPEMHALENGVIGSSFKEYTSKSPTDNTLIVGDLNNLPFHSTIQSPTTFNAIHVKEVVRTIKTRKVALQDHDYFYNPMWSLMGDYNYLTDNEKIAGTYYFDTDDPARYHWNVLDGVILNANMMDKILMSSLEIVTTINGKDLVLKSPARDPRTFLDLTYSDHLPITFTIQTV